MKRVPATFFQRQLKADRGGAEEQGRQGEFSPPHPRIPAPLLIIGLLTALTVSACNHSSAATQPFEAENNLPSPAPINRSAGQPTSQLPTQPPLQPTASPTSTPQPTDTPTPTVTPSPTATPTPSLRQLTRGGCCVQPFFSPDGRQILFIDKPAEDAPVGIYGIDIQNSVLKTQNDFPTPTLVTSIIGFRSSDRTLVATIEGDLASFINEASGESWAVNTGGNWPRYSPDGNQIIWTATDREGPYDRRQSDIWLANVDGSNPKLLLSMFGGGFAGWFPDSRRVLLLGKDVPSDERRTMFVYDPDNSRRTDLFTHKRIRQTEISPDGSWVAFFLSMTDDEPVENGLWVVSADGDSQQKLDVPGFGAYRWRDDHTLLYIPMRTSAEESMQLWAVDVTTNRSWPLTDPTRLTFSISNGDWDVSPNGRHVVFVNSQDQNIWLITLP